MANVTITIPDALVPRIRAAARATFPQHVDLTDVDLFKQVTADYWRKVLADYEQKLAEEAYVVANRNTISAAHAQAVTDAAGIV